MCDKSNDMICFDDMKLTRSTRRERHKIEANDSSDDKTKDTNKVGIFRFCVNMLV